MGDDSLCGVVTDVSVRGRRASRGVLVAAAGSLTLVLAVGSLSGAVNWPGGTGFAAIRRLTGPLSFGVFGLAACGDSEDAIERLTAKIRGFRAGDDVDFSTDRDDEIGDLYDAVDEMASETRERTETLEAERDRFTALFENASSEVARVELTDGDAVVRAVNGAFEATFGCDESDAVGRSLSDLAAPPADVEDAPSVAAQARDGSQGQREVRRRTADGERTFVAQFAPIENDGASEEGYAVYTDVTDCTERERMLETLVENTISAVYVKDPDGTYRFVNRAAGEFLGLDSTDVVGANDVELFGEETAAEIRQQDEHVLETGEAVTEEVVRPADGTDRLFLDNKFPYRDRNGEIIGILGISRDVTERETAERRLRERERRLERYREYTDDVLDAVDDVFYVLDGDWSFERWNESLTEVTGYDDEEIEGMHARELFDEGDAERIVAALEDIDERIGEPLEADFRTKDGESIPYEFVAAPLEDPDGDRVVAGIGRDITERREKERQLREREQRLEQYKEYTDDVLDSIGDVFYVVGSDGTLQRWNRSMVDVTGYSDEELASIQPVELVVEDDRDAIASAIRETFETGSARREARVLTRDGRTIPYEFVGSTLEDPDGNPVLVGIGRDVSERKEREREVRETNERLQKFIETSPVGIVATDPGGTVTLWNDAMERIFGWSADEVLGEPYPAVPEEAEVEASVRQRALDGESFSGVELRRRTKSGERIDVSLSTAPIRDETGSVTEVVGYIEDVTDRKRRERALAARSAAIEESIDGVAILDEDKVYEYVNRSHADIYGYDHPSAFVGETWGLCYGDDERERLKSEVLPVLREDGGWRGEAVGRRADGTTFPQEVSLTALEDGRTICVVRDVTGRKRRETELERTKELLAQAQRTASIGGWELDVETEVMNWTEEAYRIHDLPPGSEMGLHRTMEFYHPDDRQRVWTAVERAIEHGEPYDVEVRLVTATGDERWVRSIGRPVREDGAVVALRGSIQDVTEQKERELAVESLHETAREMLAIQRPTEAADAVVEAAASVLDLDCIGVYLLDEASNRLESVAHTAAFDDVSGGAPPVTAGAESLLWDCFVAGTPTVFDDRTALDRSRLFGNGVAGGLLVPLGDHGVFVVATSGPTIDDRTRRLVETLAATTEAAFDRIESEAALRDRDAELEARNRRLERHVGLNEIIRRVDQSLVRAGSREEIEAAVCDHLAAADDVSFAWIGAVDPVADELTARAWAGDGSDYLDDAAFDADAAAPEPAARVAETGDPTVVSNVVEQLQSEPWAGRALADDFHSVVSVPLVFEEYSYGVLAVYADEPDAFGDLERTVFTELGENVAHSINAVETQRALHADTHVELTLRFDPDDAFLGQVARRTDCRLEFEGLASHSEGESRLFFSAADGDPDAVAAVLDDLVSVSEHRLVGTSDGVSLFEVTIAGDVLPTRLVRHGASPQSMRVTATEMVAVVGVPTATDVREFVEMLRTPYPSVELTGRRTVERATHTRQELVTTLFEDLTDRQLEVLRTAYFAGFFEWPRRSTGEEVAEMLGVTQPTVNRHLRVGQQRLFSQLFDGERPPVEE